MTGDNFCFWLRGYLDCYNGDDSNYDSGLNSDQLNVIDSRLKLFFLEYTSKLNDC